MSNVSGQLGFLYANHILLDNKRKHKSWVSWSALMKPASSPSLHTVMQLVDRSKKLVEHSVTSWTQGWSRSLSLTGIVSLYRDVQILDSGENIQERRPRMHTTIHCETNWSLMFYKPSCGWLWYSIVRPLTHYLPRSHMRSQKINRFYNFRSVYKRISNLHAISIRHTSLISIWDCKNSCFKWNDIQAW